jgi:hypothetical protein
MLTRLQELIIGKINYQKLETIRIALKVNVNLQSIGDSGKSSRRCQLLRNQAPHHFQCENGIHTEKSFAAYRHTRRALGVDAYLCVMPRDSIQNVFLIAGLNELDLWRAIKQRYVLK